MIRFSCPACQKHLKAPERGAGRKLLCPRCGQGLVIPRAVQVSKSTVHGEIPEAPERSPLPDPYDDYTTPQRSAPAIPASAVAGTKKSATRYAWSAVSLTLGGLSVLGGCISVPVYGLGFTLTLPLSLTGLSLAVIAWRKERCVPAIIALVLNIVAVLIGVLLAVLFWAITIGPFNRSANARNWRCFLARSQRRTFFTCESHDSDVPPATG